MNVTVQPKKSKHEFKIINYTKRKYKIAQSLLPLLRRGLGVRINEINYFIFSFGITKTKALNP